MYFRVRRSFTWAGTEYKSDDTIDIPEGHPRLQAMLRGGFITYNASSVPPIAKKPKIAIGMATEG